MWLSTDMCVYHQTALAKDTCAVVIVGVLACMAKQNNCKLYIHACSVCAVTVLKCCCSSPLVTNFRSCHFLGDGNQPINSSLF